MAGGYVAPSGGQLDVLADALKKLSDRLYELEAPTGTSMNSLVAQVQQAIADITTTVTAAITANSYTKTQIDTKDADRVAKAGDTMSGDLFIPGMTPAVSGYTVMYQDATGRLCKGASSERFKKHITEIDPLSLGDLFPPLKRWQMRNGDGVWRYGYTAEQLAASDATEQFSTYERVVEEDAFGQVVGSHLARDDKGAPIPESVDVIGLLLAQVAQLNARDLARESEIAELRKQVSGIG